MLCPTNTERAIWLAHWCCPFRLFTHHTLLQVQILFIFQACLLLRMHLNQATPEFGVSLIICAFIGPALVLLKELGKMVHLSKVFKPKVGRGPGRRYLSHSVKAGE